MLCRHLYRPAEIFMHLASPIASLKEKLAKSEIDIIQESESPLGALHALDPRVNQLILRLYATSDGPESKRRAVSSVRRTDRYREPMRPGVSKGVWPVLSL